MSSQLASLTSQFEEFKQKDRAPSQRDLPIPQEQDMCAPAFQGRPSSEGELSDDSNLPSRKRCRSTSPQGEADAHHQELDLSYVEMLNAIRGFLDLEVPQVECLVAR